MEKKFIISDVHGCYKTLLALFEKIGLTKSHKVIFLGDYIEKGPRSKETVDLLITMQNEGYDLTCLMGNHEDLILYTSTAKHLSLRKTYDASSQAFFTSGGDLKERYGKWFEKLKLFDSDDQQFFVHAGITFYDGRLSRKKDDYLYRYSSSIDTSKVIHGHFVTGASRIQSDIENRVNIISIDNGVFLKDVQGYGSLVCLEVNLTNLFYQKNLD